MPKNNPLSSENESFTEGESPEEYIYSHPRLILYLGKPAEWPVSLKGLMSVIIHQPVAMCISWGPDFLQIYNAAFARLLKDRDYPDGLGSTAHNTFADNWPILNPVYTRAMNGQPAKLKSAPLYNGQISCKVKPVDIACGPIYGENGKISGILTTVTETAEYEPPKKLLLHKDIANKVILHSPIGVCVLDAESLQIEMANQAFLKKPWNAAHPPLPQDNVLTHKPLFVKKVKEVIESATSLTVREQELMSGYNREEQKSCATYIFCPIKKEGKVEKIAIWEVDSTLDVKAIKRIEEREQEMRTLVESAPFPIGVFTGEEIKIEMANQSILDAWGKGNQVIGKLYTDILPEFENQEIFDQIRQVYKTGVPFHAINRRVDLVKKGKLAPYYFNYSLIPLYNSSGKVYGVLNTAAEVTELQEAKQKVEKALEEVKLFRYMAEKAADSLVLIREDGTFAYLNRMATEKWGYSEEELKRSNIRQLVSNFNQEKFYQAFTNAQKGFIAPFESLVRAKDGDIYPVEVSVGGLTLDGKPSLFAIVRDITARKKADSDLMAAFKKIEESEKRFRQSVKQAPMGIVILRGHDFYVEQANEAYLHIIGKNAEDFIGRSIFDSLPETKETILPITQKIMRTGEPFFGNEFEVTLNRMGQLKTGWFNFVYHPLIEENGEISGIITVALEVTTQVEARRLLEESEQNLRNLISHSPIPMTIIRGEDLIIQSPNKAILKNIWRKEEKEVLGKPLVEVFPELKDQKYPALIRKVIDTGETYSENEAVIHFQGADGVRQFFVDYEFAPLIETEGKASGILFTGMDVTAKVDARKKVEEAEERLRLATEATGLATWDLDLVSRHIIYSPNLPEIFGYKPGKVFTHASMRSHIHPDDVFIVEKEFELALEHGMYVYEARIIRADKKIAWIRTQGKVFYDENHKPLKMLGTLREITEEKQYQQVLQKSEAKFRLLANSLSQHVWTADTNGDIYYFNDTLLKYTGLSYKQLIQGKWLQVIHPDEREENMKAWQKAISTGEDFLIEHRFRRQDGSYRWQLSRALPQRDASGKIQFWVGSSTDIQDIKEQELQKDYFISMASHELKTPLTSIKGYVQILQAMQPNVEEAFLAKSLKIIDKQINKLTDLIGELLDVSKIKSGGLDFKKERFELSDLIKEVVGEIQHINPPYKINITSETKVMIFADRNRIGQVLINLLNNAVKYSPDNYSINISSALKEGMVKIKIQDFGIGISKADHQRIFDRFYRVEGRDEKTFPGFGIGLFISSEIIKKHQGRIYLKSTLGKGSEFTIEMPAIK